jgi:hypothetical protein
MYKSLLAFFETSIMRLASSTVVAIGFWHNTGRPLEHCHRHLGVQEAGRDHDNGIDVLALGQELAIVGIGCSAGRHGRGATEILRRQIREGIDFLARERLENRQVGQRPVTGSDDCDSDGLMSLWGGAMAVAPSAKRKVRRFVSMFQMPQNS